MPHFKSIWQLRPLSLLLCLMLLALLSLLTDPSQMPLERIKDISVCLAQISVLTESLTKKRSSDQASQ